MNAGFRRPSPLVALLSLLLGTACTSGSGPTGGGPAQSRYPSGQGIVQGLSLTTLKAAGWTVCYEGDYGAAGDDIATILAGCNGTDLMLACRASASSDTLVLAAADSRSVVTTIDPDLEDGHHVANGVGWYYTGSLSWGFFPAGEPVLRLNCDGAPTVPEKRLCWEAVDGKLAGGYRCGATVDLGADVTWRRLILAH